MTFVKKGDIVTCENGHELYKIIRDIDYGETMKADQFLPLGDDVQKPENGVQFEPCKCGAPWYRPAQIHFKDGWR